MVSIVQMVRMSDSDSEGRRFEPDWTPTKILESKPRW